ncbi:putative GTPase-activator protein for Ras-like GTPase [Blattamonas nauphoetae]|uniref:GTPase-activator protein for Ras-like GTPase n=1 Tax=Blattamonas nauphoetae TaxID=2049346 RepID=A0ABQ9XK59_9EUKA|nr:putative GTPase-activator protein for Ras-like GTPase [Blattamonas nauphoetae]
MSHHRLKEVISFSKSINDVYKNDLGDYAQEKEIESIVYLKQRQLLQIEELAFNIYRKIMSVKPVPEDKILASIEQGRTQLFSIVNPLGNWEAKYSNLVFLLRSYPQLLLRMGRDLPHEELDSFIQKMIFPLFQPTHSPLERELFLRLINNAILDEIIISRDARYFLRANTFASKLLTAYSKSDECIVYLHNTIGPVVNAILANRSLDLEMDPVHIARSYKFSNCDTMEDATCQREISARLLLNKANLEHCVAVLLDRIDSMIGQIPITLRQICAVMLLSPPCASMTEDEKHSLVSSVFFLRFISPAIFTPEAFHILNPQAITWFRSQEDSASPFTHLASIPSFPQPGTLSPPVVAASINIKSRRNLTLISKVLQTSVNFGGYEEKEPYLKPLVYPFICDTRFFILHSFCRTLINVPTKYEYVPAQPPLSSLPVYQNSHSKSTGNIPPGIHMSIATSVLVGLHRQLIHQQGSFPVRSPAELVLSSLGLKVPDVSEMSANTSTIFVEYESSLEQLQAPVLHPLSFNKLRVRHPLHDIILTLLRPAQPPPSTPPHQTPVINPIARIPQMVAIPDVHALIKQAQFNPTEPVDWDKLIVNKAGFTSLRFPLSAEQISFLTKTLSPLLTYPNICTCRVPDTFTTTLFTLPAARFSTVIPRPFVYRSHTNSKQTQCLVHSVLENTYLDNIPTDIFAVQRPAATGSFSGRPSHTPNPISASSTPEPANQEGNPRKLLVTLSDRLKSSDASENDEDALVSHPSPPQMPALAMFDLPPQPELFFPSLPLEKDILSGETAEKKRSGGVREELLEDDPVPTNLSCFTTRPPFFSRDWSQSIASTFSDKKATQNRLSQSIRGVYKVIASSEGKIAPTETDKSQDEHGRPERGVFFFSTETIATREKLRDELLTRNQEILEKGKELMQLSIEAEEERRKKEEADWDITGEEEEAEGGLQKRDHNRTKAVISVEETEDTEPLKCPDFLPANYYHRMYVKGEHKEAVQAQLVEIINTEQAKREEYQAAKRRVELMKIQREEEKMLAAMPKADGGDDWDITGEEEEIIGGLKKRDYTQGTSEAHGITKEEQIVDQYEKVRRMVLPFNITRGLEREIQNRIVGEAEEQMKCREDEKNTTTETLQNTSISALSQLFQCERARLHTTGQSPATGKAHHRSTLKRVAGIRRTRRPPTSNEDAKTRAAVFVDRVEEGLSDLPASMLVDPAQCASHNEPLVNHSPFIETLHAIVTSTNSLLTHMTTSRTIFNSKILQTRSAIASQTSAALLIRLSLMGIPPQIKKLIYVSQKLDQKEVKKITERLGESLETIVQKAIRVGYECEDENIEIVGPYIWKMKDMQRMELLDDRKKDTSGGREQTGLPFELIALEHKLYETATDAKRPSLLGEEDGTRKKIEKKGSHFRQKKKDNNESIYNTAYPPSSSPFLTPLAVPSAAFTQGLGCPPSPGSVVNDNAKIFLFSHSPDSAILCFVNSAATDVDSRLIFAVSVSGLISAALSSSTIRIGTLTFRSSKFVIAVCSQLFSVKSLS